MHSLGVDEPIVVYDGASTTNKNWLYADHLGSIVALANTTGTATATYTYSAEGKQGGSAAIRFGYTGQQNLSGLGVQYYKARMYSADLGRFIQTDLIGMADDMNLYAYVGNDSINLTDPSGEVSVSMYIRALAVLAGIANGNPDLPQGKPDPISGQSTPIRGTGEAAGPELPGRSNTPSNQNIRSNSGIRPGFTPQATQSSSFNVKPLAAAGVTATVSGITTLALTVGGVLSLVVGNAGQTNDPCKTGNRCDSFNSSSGSFSAAANSAGSVRYINNSSSLVPVRSFK